MEENTREWNAPSYQNGCSFVWELGRAMIDLLAPQPRERILDIGCGTGQLTAEIARSGACLTGIDSSAAMIGQAQGNFPDLRFEVADIRRLPFQQEFEAVFSNAALHWVLEADAAAASIARALAPGGRFVAEFGGYGNVRGITACIYTALEEFGVQDPSRLNPWYYPSVGGYAALLEAHALEVRFAALFDRPTTLEGDDGLSLWLATFGRCFTEAVPPERRAEFDARVNALAAPQFRTETGWTIDYRRLRVAAVKIA